MSDTDLTPEELTDSTESAIDSADAVEETTTEADMESTSEAVTAEAEEAVEATEETAEVVSDVVEEAPAVEASPVVEELADPHVVISPPELSLDFDPDEMNDEEDLLK